MRAIDPITGVTQKQELFCQAIVDGMSQTQAYKTAGYSYQNMLPATVVEAASHLVAKYNVATRIQQLKATIDAAVLNRTVWTKEIVIDKAEVSYNGAIEAKQFSAANGALKLIADTAGLTTPVAAAGGVTQVVVVLNHGSQTNDTASKTVDADDWFADV